jgi:flagellar basal body-associated protein FliL
MVRRNIVVAIIIIVLFVLLAMVGYAIYMIQNRVGGMRGRASDEEDVDDG